MKGSTPTNAEKQFHALVASLGCIACYLDGVFNDYISIHHIDGRTKPGCHRKVLGLCAPHHQQDDSDPMQRIAVHGNKGRFEARYGSQASLLALTLKLLGMTA